MNVQFHARPRFMNHPSWSHITTTIRVVTSDTTTFRVTPSQGVSEHRCKRTQTQTHRHRHTDTQTHTKQFLQTEKQTHQMTCTHTHAHDTSCFIAGVAANILAGCIIGIRQTLTGIVSATLVFTGSNHEEITEMFPFGISMMWYSTMAGSAFYAAFGRLQYNTNATQEVCAILYGAMAQNAALFLKRRGKSDLIQPTILALIVSSTMLTGVCSVLLGKLGVGKLMLRFPTPVTNGFLGTIGWFLVRTALQVSSGVLATSFFDIAISCISIRTTLTKCLIFYRCCCNQS